MERANRFGLDSIVSSREYYPCSSRPITVENHPTDQSQRAGSSRRAALPSSATQQPSSWQTSRSSIPTSSSTCSVAFCRISSPSHGIPGRLRPRLSVPSSPTLRSLTRTRTTVRRLKRQRMTRMMSRSSQKSNQKSSHRQKMICYSWVAWISPRS